MRTMQCFTYQFPDGDAIQCQAWVDSTMLCVILAVRYGDETEILEVYSQEHLEQNFRRICNILNEGNPIAWREV